MGAAGLLLLSEGEEHRLVQRPCLEALSTTTRVYTSASHHVAAPASAGEDSCQNANLEVHLGGARHGDVDEARFSHPHLLNQKPYHTRASTHLRAPSGDFNHSQAASSIDQPGKCDFKDVSMATGSPVSAAAASGESTPPAMQQASRFRESASQQQFCVGPGTRGLFSHAGPDTSGPGLRDAAADAPQSISTAALALMDAPSGAILHQSKHIPPKMRRAAGAAHWSLCQFAIKCRLSAGRTSRVYQVRTVQKEVCMQAWLTYSIIVID